jgi:hypothetical protein
MHTIHLHRARAARLVLALLSSLVITLALTAAASAAIELTEFTAEPKPNARTPIATAAGSHPNFELEWRIPQDDGTESTKTLRTELPPGVVFNPRVVEYCPPARYAGSLGGCPPSSIASLGRVYNIDGNPTAIFLFALKPHEGEAARLGVRLGGNQGGYLTAKVTPEGGYAIKTVLEEPSRAIDPITRITITLWGVPRDNLPSTLTPKAALYYPTQCSDTLTTTIWGDSYQHPGVFDTAGWTAAAPTGCESVPFTPAIDVEPDSHEPGIPSGYSIDLTVPQTDDPNAIGQSHLKDASVTLPEGVSLSPSAADGLEACTDAQLAIASDVPSVCPAASKIGTASLATPLLDDPLEGSIYVGSQTPGDPYRIFLVLRRGTGVLVKLKGSVSPDAHTGQLTTTFEDNPQMPFSKLSLKLKGGPRAPLANPTTCGEKTVTSVLTPWSGNAAAEPSDTFTIDCAAPSGFSPAFDAGMVTATGGAFSPFVLRLDRDDSDEMLGGLSLEMPDGLLAKIQGVEQCSDARAAVGTCAPASKVGTATVGAGSGPDPFFLRGEVFLTGPYKGAPLGLAVVVRALAGPYDLGTVVVRQALHVDPDDAHVSVISDPFPTILEGVPLRLRSVNVDMDREGFTVNPTSCDAERITGEATSTAGSTASLGRDFRAAGCAALPFAPTLALRLTGKGQRAPGSHPGLKAVLTQPGGQANIDRVRVKLPSSLALDPENANGLCSYEGGLNADCPASSKIGTARAYSPLMNRPLSGPVYFVQGVRFDKETGNRIRTLPTLLVKLRGEVEIHLRAKSSVAGKSLVSTFAAIPDAPVSRFSMRLRSGKGGILAVTGERSLCARAHQALVETDAQNGRRRDFVASVKTSCRR